MAAPVHVLMLPSGTATDASDKVEPELEQCLQENRGDYLDRRNEYFKKQKTGKDPGEAAGGDAGGDEGAQPKKEGSADGDDGRRDGGGGGSGGGRGALWSGSSPLEVAVAACCDHESADAAASPAAAAAGENSDADSSSSSSPMVESGSSDAGTDSGGDEGEKTPAFRCGAIGRGNEGQFAALIARHCHTAGDRALALAVLQRTMERDEEISRWRGKKRKRREELANKSPVAEGSDEIMNQASSEAKAEGTGDTETDDGEIYCHRMANFLSAGGLKVLNQWLTDAFTPVPASASALLTKEKPKWKKPSKEPDRIAATTTSPTGPILLPLLSILQSIPFNMELVMDSQINKQIKKLKKNLDKLVANFDEEESKSDSGNSSGSENEQSKPKGRKRTLEELTHPVSGGMPVVQVQKDVEKLMQTWKVAASDKSGKDAPDFYGDLHAKMGERFLALSNYEAGEAEKPPWLEKLEPPEVKSPPQASSASAASMQKKRAAIDGLLVKKKREEMKRSKVSRRLQQQQAALKAAQAARQQAREKMEQYRKRMLLREDGMTKKRKAESEVQEEPLKNKGVPLRKVTWADQKTAGAKLIEVREFVRETDVYQSEEEKRGQDIDDESDEKFEEDDFDDGDYDDETQASDSVDSDDLDGIPFNEEDANFSQEEEAGFTFETQELTKGKSGKGIQLGDIDDDEDGWETFTYDM